ncbi:TfoX/Sxy family protein [Saccharicrinis sp. GN24d3]|uniref:TfoX/Sxy family protein n=1 Tax=Saccharicrinis sp. GN24d3 TaxID=3458416 RepID=UPI004036775C
MAVSNDFIQYVLDQLSGWGNVQVKRMFGGAALYQEELAFGMIMNDEVYLKVDETNRAKFEETGSTQLKPFKNNKTVLSFYNVPPDVFEDADEFTEWAKESYTIQKNRII